MTVMLFVDCLHPGPISKHMKIGSILYGALIVFTSATSQLQAVFNIGEISPTELDQRLKESVRGGNGPAMRAEMISAAIKAKRLDLLQVCIDNPFTVQETLKAAIDINDKELQQRVIIMGLRCDSTIIWPDDNPATISNGIRPEVMVEPFISVIPQLLPHLELNERWLKYRNSREKLAKDMETVLDTRGSKSIKATVSSIESKPDRAVMVATSTRSLATKLNQDFPLIAWVAAGGLVLVILFRILRKNEK